MSEKRQQAYKWGRFAETLCLWLLRVKGYRILAHGYKQKTGEIDIIAKRGQLIVFIEVKARHDYQTASHAITPTQQQRITRSAQAFTSQNPQFAECDLRFDAMLVMPWKLPIHLKDAWRPNF